MGEDSYRRPSTLEDLSSRSRTREKYERDDSTFATSALDELHYRREMRGMVVSLALMTACGFDGSAGTTPGDPIVDAPTIPACTPGFVNLCGQPKPTGSLVVTDANDDPINTNADPRCRVIKQGNGVEVCLMYFTTIEIPSNLGLLFYGSRPLALAAMDSIKIAGTLDVSSKALRLDRPGAGSNPSSLCSFGREPDGVVGGGAGGAGGTLATVGGAGGISNVTSPPQAGGEPATAISSLTALRGGCSGQQGNAGSSMARGGLGGPGGGAIYLSAPAIQISGKILAGGGGGASTGSATYDGGGGGGSGGVIVLESDSIQVSGVLLATGGGGGQGADNNDPGAPGSDATTLVAAPGGAEAGAGGFGGAGALATNGSNGVADTNGGGGGGGGAGFIFFLGSPPTTTGAMIMPPAVIPPAVLP